MSAIDVKLDKAFRATVKEVFNDALLYQTVGEILRTSIQKNFDKEGRYGDLIDGVWQGGSNTWKSLSDSRIKQRTKKGHWPGKILQDTGGLKTAVTVETGKKSVTVGIAKNYADYLQFGTEKMEARPIVVIQDEDLIEIEAAVEELMRLKFGP